MATSHLPRREIEIAKPGDLTVEIMEYGTKSTKRRATIRVDKAKLIEHSTYFRKMFRFPWVEGQGDTITLEDDNIKSLEVWFRHIHDNLSEISIYSVSVADIWHIIMASDKYDFNRKYLAAWFVQWYTQLYNFRVGEKPTVNDPHLVLRRQLLFPCYSFNYAIGFQALTKDIAYKYPTHITEVNPTEVFQMHLPRRVIQQLNAAKGRLRTILHRELFSVIAKIVKEATCVCKEKTVFNYQRELQRIGVWPLEDAFPKACMKEVLDKMLYFDGTKMTYTKSTPGTSGTSTQSMTSPRPSSRPDSRSSTQARSSNQTDSCLYCTHDWKRLVTKARSTTLKYFDGLCMDCMAATKNVKLTRDEDKDYWRHHEEKGEYDVGCRISHGEPTWYFSFMGRREKLGKFDQPADFIEEGNDEQGFGNV